MSPIKTILLLSILLIAATSVSAQQPCNRHVEPNGGFSTCVPEGWTVLEREGQRFKLFVGPRGERFTSNINFKEGSSALPLHQYATEGIETILKNYPTIGATLVTNLTKKTFVTDKGLVGVKATFHAEYTGLMIRTIQYYFGDVERKLIMTCTGLEAEEAALVRACDRAAKNFQLEVKSSPATVK